MDEPDVAESVQSVRGGFVFSAGSGGFAIGHAEGSADLEFGIDGFERAEGVALGNFDDVRGAHAIGQAAARGRVNAPSVAEEGKDPGLVEDAPIANAVAEGFGHDLRVVREARDEVAIGPAAGVFESLREVPLIERADGADLRF